MESSSSTTHLLLVLASDAVSESGVRRDHCPISVEFRKRHKNETKLNPCLPASELMEGRRTKGTHAWLSPYAS